MKIMTKKQSKKQSKKIILYAYENYYKLKGPTTYTDSICMCYGLSGECGCYRE